MARTGRPRVDDGWSDGRGHVRHREVVRVGAASAGRGPSRGGRLVTPLRVVLLLALVGSLAYVAFAITVRDASQIPMLSSGAAVLGVVFAILALAGGVATYRAGQEGDGRRAFRNAALGGIAAMIAASCFAGAVVLALVWTG